MSNNDKDTKKMVERDRSSGKMADRIVSSAALPGKSDNKPANKPSDNKPTNSSNSK